MRAVTVASFVARLIWPLSVAATLFVVTSCQRRPDPVRPPATAQQIAAYQAATAKFERDSFAWARTKIVRDSISRTINTDSLYHLYHVMLLSPHPIPLLSLLHCERFRLVWRYGAEPTIAAERRMYDTLWTPDERKLANEKNEEFDPTVAEMVTLGVGPKRCGPMGPFQPDVVAGARFDEDATLPVRPKKP